MAMARKLRVQDVGQRAIRCLRNKHDLGKCGDQVGGIVRTPFVMIVADISEIS